MFKGAIFFYSTECKIKMFLAIILIEKLFLIYEIEKYYLSYFLPRMFPITRPIITTSTECKCLKSNKIIRFHFTELLHNVNIRFKNL